MTKQIYGAVSKINRSGDAERDANLFVKQRS